MRKVLLVTGASRGIGAATALRAARDGWEIAVNYRSAGEEAQQVARAIRDSGGRAEAIAADVADPAAVSALFATIRARFGRLDGLVNNAGILPKTGRFDEIAPERWQRTFAVNTLGTYLCCREAVRMMAPRHGGTGGAIVNLSSMAAVFGGAGEFIDYGASKGAVDTLTLGLAKELGPEGIRVNGVRPGVIETAIHASAGDAGRVQRLAAAIPMGRPGTAEETAEAIVWLLSPAASYVSGTTVTVSGGR